MPYDEMRARAAEQAGVSLSPLATTADDTTKWWRAEGHAGRVGFISSMSDHFCAGCAAAHHRGRRPQDVPLRRGGRGLAIAA